MERKMFEVIFHYRDDKNIIRHKSIPFPNETTTSEVHKILSNAPNFYAWNYYTDYEKTPLSSIMFFNIEFNQITIDLKDGSHEKFFVKPTEINHFIKDIVSLCDSEKPFDSKQLIKKGWAKKEKFINEYTVESL